MVNRKYYNTGHWGWRVALFLIIVSIFYILSRAIVYFSTGADMSQIYKQTATLIIESPSFVEWVDVEDDNGKRLDDYTRDLISKAYGRAWLTWDQAISEGVFYGLEDFFTQPVFDRIIQESYNENPVVVKRATLSHSLSLKFVSKDHQYIVFTDSDIDFVRSIFQEDIPGAMTYDKADYLVHMVQKDGRWKISNLKRLKAEQPLTPAVSTPDSFVTVKEDYLFHHGQKLQIKGINYYPMSSPWDWFWPDFDEDVIRSDFKKINDLGLNSVRIFMPYRLFGKGTDTLQYVEHFTKLIDIAKELDLYVLPTLFDFPSSYSFRKYPEFNDYIERIVDAAKNKSNVLAWDVKNEPDLDYKVYSKAEVDQFLRFAVDRIMTYDPHHLVTIGWSDISHIETFSEELDILSFHHYGKLETLESSIGLAKEKFNKPVFLEEYGRSSFSSWWYPIGYSEQSQANYTRSVMTLLSENSGVSGFIWCMYDYPEMPAHIYGWRPWIKGVQSHFGVFNEKGRLKKAGELFGKE